MKEFDRVFSRVFCQFTRQCVARQFTRQVQGAMSTLLKKSTWSNLQLFSPLPGASVSNVRVMVVDLGREGEGVD